MSATQTRPAASVDVHDLRIELTGTDIDVVDEIALEIHPGEVLGLVGESGSGKTTVGMALLGHVRRGGKLGGGVVRIDGQDIAELHGERLRALRGGVVSYIPQDPGTSLNPALRISTQLEEIMEAHAAGRSEDVRRERLREALEEVALPSDETFLRRYPHQLSGGQQQRVAIAMAFANRPHVIVCDEPTTGLDVTTQSRVLETVRDLCRSHRVAALYVSHDLAVVAELADRVAVMYAGRIVESGPREVMFADPSHPYTRRLLRAVPDIAGKRTVVGIPGHAALPGNRPNGCTFHPRCEFAQDDCRATFPPAGEVGPAHKVRCWHVAEVARETPPEGAGQTGRHRIGEDVVLSVRDLDARYGAAQALFDINVEVRHNECVALVGESGSGKTTLARCVSGLHKDYTGEVRLGADAAARGGALALGRRAQGHPVRLPEPVRVAEPAAHRRPDRSPASSRSSVRGARADARAAWASASSGSPSPAPPPTASPTSSPAASASGWRSPAPWRPSHGCSSATR